VHRANQEEDSVNLSAPQKTTWWVALIVGIIGIIAKLVTLPVLSAFAFWILAVAFVILVLATYLKGL
jgi:nicotinamide riboside transporter PnuC